MRETKFIEQKKEQWERFEGVLKSKHRDADEMSDLFVQVTDDLSYARTFYPNRSVRVYLNGLAQQIFVGVYKNKPFKWANFVAFWREELPDLMWDCRWQFLIAAVAFWGGGLLGWFSTAMDFGFCKTMLGEGYIAMTKANVLKGDPMAVYKQSAEAPMFLQIMWNNLVVCFRDFLLGLLWGVGSVAAVFYEGVRLGSFFKMLHSFGAFSEAMLTVWLHGVFEISAIILAGTAGAVLGKGLAFPGSYNRLQSFQLAAGRAFRIMAGISPILMCAAFIEGFITRHTEVPPMIRGGLILCSLIFILAYFVWYPYRRFKAGIAKQPAGTELPPDDLAPIVWGSVRDNGAVLKDMFKLYRLHFSSNFWTAFAATTALVTILWITNGNHLSEKIVFTQWHFYYSWTAVISNQVYNLFSALNLSKLPHIFALSSWLFFSYYNTYILHQIAQHREAKNENISVFQFALRQANGLKIMFLTGLLTASMYGDVYYFFAILPFILLIMYVWVNQINNPFRAIGASISGIFATFLQCIGLYFMMLLFSLIFSFLMSSDLVTYLFELIQWNLPIGRSGAQLLLKYLMMFTSFLFLLMVTPLFTYAIALLYGTMDEIANATQLRKEVANIGTHRNLRGLMRE